MLRNIKIGFTKPKNNLFIFQGIVRAMYQEDKVAESTSNNCEFGVLADVLRTLQMEELEGNASYPAEVPEINITQNIMEIIAEINNTLKEIAETQKKILEEIKRNRAE
jgi:hypothetical protein